jgi:hypothetical protein
MSATAKVSTGFNIEGRYLANICRDFVREGNWERGLKMLTENLMGMTHEIAIAILKGEADLTGWSSDEAGIGLEKLEPTGELAVAMRERLDYLYGPIFRHKQGYWKPYAQVLGWCREDMDFAQSESTFNILDGSTHTRGVRENAKLARRSLYYARRPHEDMLVFVQISEHLSVDLLCERTDMPPLWFDVSTKQPFEHLKHVFETMPEVLEQLGADETQPSLAEAKTRAESPPPVQDLAARQKREQEDEARFDAETQARERKVQTMQADVREQAALKGGYLNLAIKGPKGERYAKRPTLEVPRNPFLLWALRGFDFEANGKERPAWAPVCPMGWKLPLDDQNHSDWVLGAGLDIDETYGADEDTFERLVQSSAYEERARLVQEWTGSEFVVLARGPHKYLCANVVVAKPHQRVPAGSIALAATAGPEYQLAMESANCEDAHGNRGVLICATGGKLAHLAIVGREFKCTVLMVPNAVERFGKMNLMSIDFLKGTLYQTA